MNVRCAHCGADVAQQGAGPTAHCSHCGGWSLSSPGGSTALDIAKLPIRFDRDSMLAGFVAHAQAYGFGAPHVLDARTEWVPHLAREGRVDAVGREFSGRFERTFQGLLGVALGPDRGLSLEEFDASALTGAPEWSSAVPAVSLDDFDALVRERVTARMREAALGRGNLLADVDLHAVWGPRAHLVHVPILSISFSLASEPAVRRKAQLSFHDGQVRVIELAKKPTAPGLGRELLDLLTGVAPAPAMPSYARIAEPRQAPRAPAAVAAPEVEALSCAACGAPLDIASARGDLSNCSSCGTTASLADRGIQRVRRFELGISSLRAEQILRREAAAQRVTVARVEARPTVHRFLGRNAAMRGSVYGMVLVEGGLPLGRSIKETEVRSESRDFTGRVAVAASPDCPLPCFEIANPEELVPRGDALLAEVEVTIRNLDETLRAALSSSLECSGRQLGWVVGSVEVAGHTHGELMEIWATFVELRYQIAPPGWLARWDDEGNAGWYATLCAPDGRFVGGSLPSRLPSRGLRLALLAAAALALVLIAGVVVVAMVML